ncbi:MAG: hypothetical protein WCX17_02080 [Parcubacteria group bacterium]|jgi:hypothetical protein
MVEEFKLYDDQGKVEDPEVARKMAKAEDSYHEKTLGIFPASRKKIAEGEKFSEFIGECVVDGLNEEQERNECIKSFEFSAKGATLQVNGHLLELFCEPRWDPEHDFGEENPAQITNLFAIYGGMIDGVELSNSDLEKVKDRFEGYVTEKYLHGGKEVKIQIRKKAQERNDELTTKNKSAIEDVLK